MSRLCLLLDGHAKLVMRESRRRHLILTETRWRYTKTTLLWHAAVVGLHRLVPSMRLNVWLGLPCLIWLFSPSTMIRHATHRRMLRCHHVRLHVRLCNMVGHVMERLLWLKHKLALSLLRNAVLRRLPKIIRAI